MIFAAGLMAGAEAVLTGELSPVNKVKNGTVVCADIRNCETPEDNPLYHLTEEQVDGYNAQIDKAVAAKEAELKRRLTESEKHAVAVEELRLIFNGLLSKNKRKYSKKEKGAMFEEFVNSVVGEDE